MRWTRWRRQTNAACRVRRSRVVLTPQWLASSLQSDPQATETTKPNSPGRARSKPSNHCAGKAGLPPLNLYARVRFLSMPFAHETAGAARTRSSLLPLLSRDAVAAKLGQNHAARMRRRTSCLKFESENSSVVPDKRAPLLISPPPTRPCAWRGGVGGGGSAVFTEAAVPADRPPTPDLESELRSPRTPPLRGGSGNGSAFARETPD